MNDIIAAVNSEDGDYRIEISNGETYENPREYVFEPLGEMVCWHKRINMGDETHIGWDSKEKYDYAKAQALKFKKEDIGIAVPLYLYDHSGMTMATVPFGDRFDSGQVGIYLASKENIISQLKEYTDKTKEKAIGFINLEVKEYDLYLRGEAYSFECYYKEELVYSIYDTMMEYDDFIKDYLPDNVPEEFIPLIAKLELGVIEPEIEIPMEDKMATYAH